MIKLIKRYLKVRRTEKMLKKTIEKLEAGKITPNEARNACGLPPIETRKIIIESEVESS